MKKPTKPASKRPKRPVAQRPPLAFSREEIEASLQAPSIEDEDDDFEVLFPVGIYDPPYEGLLYIGYIGMPTGDYLTRPFGTREEALAYVENTATALLLGQGKQRQ